MTTFWPLSGYFWCPQCGATRWFPEGTLSEDQTEEIHPGEECEHELRTPARFHAAPSEATEWPDGLPS